MAEITKINIKGVDYDIGGTGGGSALYVLEKTLPEGTTDIPIIELTAEEFNNLWEQDLAVIKAKLTQEGFGEIVGEYKLLTKSHFIMQGSVIVSKAMLFKYFTYFDYLGLMDVGVNYEVVAICTRDIDTDVESVNVYKLTGNTIVVDGSSLVFDSGSAGFEFSEEAKAQIKMCKAFGVPFTVKITDLHADGSAYGTITFFNNVVDPDTGVITSTPYTYISKPNKLISISFGGIDSGSNVLSIKTLTIQ